MPTRLLLIIAVLVALCAPSTAQAATQTYKGNTDFWQDLDVTVTEGQITHFKGIVGAVACNTESGEYMGESDNWSFDTNGPFPIVDGHFHFVTPPTESDSRGGESTVTVDGDLRDGVLQGTVTVHMDGFVADSTCHATVAFEAATAPKPINYSSRKPNFTGAPVSFRYSRGRITQLLATGYAFCGNDQDNQVSLSWYSNANHADPISVDKRGRFQIDTMGVDIGSTKHVIHVVLAGQIKGDRATGTLTLTGRNGNHGKYADCRFQKHWSAVTTGPVAGPNEPLATFSTLPLRTGRAGSYQYWLQIRTQGCTNASRVQVKVAGRARFASCFDRIVIGPLAPKRIYAVSATAVQYKHGKIRRRGPANTRDVYLPGEDGYWVKTDGEL
ncbi:MAG: hypothetical protein QOJ29_2439 [Thermoleophilaceae bacterium]|jgi:hypothetical protein|nr:hypothetical protein [Thermoleophilaceae bacterium]